MARLNKLHKKRGGWHLTSKIVKTTRVFLNLPLDVGFSDTQPVDKSDLNMGQNLLLNLTYVSLRKTIN